MHKEWAKTQIYVLATDFTELQIKYHEIVKDFVKSETKYNELDDINADLHADIHIKDKIIENLTKVIKSQEEEIHQLKKQDYTQSKRRAWHY